MKKTVRDIYDEYRNEMAQTLAIEEIDPVSLVDPEFFAYFAKKVERLDTLIELYASLLASHRN